MRRDLTFIVVIREDSSPTSYGCNYKGSTFFSVILRPSAQEPCASSLGNRHLSNFAYCYSLNFFRTIALLLGALRDLIVGYSKLSSASVECRREIFSRTNFHLRVVSLGINVSSLLRDDKRRTGEGTEQCRQTERTPRHYNLDFSSSSLLLRQFQTQSLICAVTCG